MAEAGDPGAEDWQRAAEEYLAAAGTLARARRWRSVYQEAGLALECALKARIMRVAGLNRWPSRGERPDLYTHDPDLLLRHAGLLEAVEREVADQTPAGRAWMVAKDFSINRRYPDGRPFPMRLARDMLRALREDGLLAWILDRKS